MKHKIKTIQDILDCTNENNVDDFLCTFKSFLIASHSFRKAHRVEVKEWEWEDEETKE